MKYWLGIEIGGTKQQIGIVGDDGSVIKSSRESRRLSAERRISLTGWNRKYRI